ncbi:MAG: SGNH/GDSL hydrolase family protein [Bacteroidota bacterium]
MRKGGLYLALGDSTVWCNYETGATGDDLYSTKLYKAIRLNYGNIKHLNKGLGGHDSSELVSNFYWNGRLTPDLLTIGIGMNDCANQAISLANFEINLNKVISYWKQQNPNIVIILCTPNTTTEATRTPYIASYRSKMNDIAIANNIFICDFSTGWTTEQIATYCSSDTIHPNKAGHQVLHNLLYPVVQSAASNWLSGLG